MTLRVSCSFEPQSEPSGASAAGDDVLLQRVVDLGPLHRRRPRAHRLEGLDPHRVRRHAHRHAGHVLGLAHRLVGDQVALAEEAVGHDQLEAGGLELLLDALVPVGGEQLVVVVRVLDQVGAVEHADVGHEVGEVAGVGDVHHVRALADHLVDLLAGAELLAREDLDLHLVVGALRRRSWRRTRRRGAPARWSRASARSGCGSRPGRRRAPPPARRPATGRARAVSWMSPGGCGDGGGDVGRDAHFWRLA